MKLTDRLTDKIQEYKAEISLALYLETKLSFQPDSIQNALNWGNELLTKKWKPLAVYKLPNEDTIKVLRELLKDASFNKEMYVLTFAGKDPITTYSPIALLQQVYKHDSQHTQSKIIVNTSDVMYWFYVDTKKYNTSRVGCGDLVTKVREGRSYTDYEYYGSFASSDELGSVPIMKYHGGSRVYYCSSKSLKNDFVDSIINLLK